MKTIARCMTCKETKECFVTSMRTLKRTGEIKQYTRCNKCHAANMKPVMQRRYATPEGRIAMIAEQKRWRAKKKLEKVNG